jgi:Cys-Gly metallodipeptidase DUG1
VTDLVIKYVEDEFKKLGSKNKLEVVLTHGGEPWIVSGVFLVASFGLTSRLTRT